VRLAEEVGASSLRLFDSKLGVVHKEIRPHGGAVKKECVKRFPSSASVAETAIATTRRTAVER